MLELASLDLTRLERVTYRSKWVQKHTDAGLLSPRNIYRDDAFYYKIWAPDYAEHKWIVHRGHVMEVDIKDLAGRERLIGDTVGFYSEKTCPAFAGHIYDGDRLAGYRTHVGAPVDFSVSDPRIDALIEDVIEATISSGYAHQDFKPRNVIELPDGRLSLVDLEAPLFVVHGLRINTGRRASSIRAKITLPAYHSFLLAVADETSKDPRAVRARERWTSPPPYKAIRAVGRPPIEELEAAPPAVLQETPLSYIPNIRLPSGEITPGKRIKGNLRRRNAVVASSLDVAGKRVLDVGCSQGIYALNIARSAAQVVGIDHRSSQIAIARDTAQALGIDNATFEHGDVRDPEFLKKHGKFDLIIAWGFLHRVTDLFSLLYSLEPLADAISLEWRTPVMPLMSTTSIAYHPPGGPALDPMNVGSGPDVTEVRDAEKIEGGTAFWEPTPGAVSAILDRLGYKGRLIGYDEKLYSEERAIARHWYSHLKRINEGLARFDRFPRARVHMIFEKEPGSIRLHPLKGAEKRFPSWDKALHDAFGK